MPLDFNCDRQAKCDFTASTYNYWRENGADGDIRFYEMTSASTLVPFGDDRAFTQSRFDVFMSYEDLLWYAIELKEREHPSTYKYTVEEGAYLNPEKKEVIHMLEKQGYTPIWCELYTDGIIRIWNFAKIDVDSLPMKVANIKKVNIDPNSTKRQQPRYLLPISAATEYKRYHDE